MYLVAVQENSNMQVGDLYYVARRLKAHAEQSLGAKPGDIAAFPVPQRLILGYILHSPGATIQELANHLSLAQSVVSTGVASLRDRDLVTTEVDPADRRRVRVAPSKVLRRWARTKLHTEAQTVLDPLLEDLKAKDKECVLKALTLLNETFRRKEDEGSMAKLVVDQGGSP
jgi:DNA-binding MarR family transcriptional regulator